MDSPKQTQAIAKAIAYFPQMDSETLLLKKHLHNGEKRSWGFLKAFTPTD